MDKLVFIPAYMPDERLPEICRKLSGEYSVFVVDDGSGPDFDKVFEATSEFATVERYETNRGKGGALKYGFSRIRELFPDADYIITADADGQHTPEDIKKVADAVENKGGMVLGARAFAGKVPFRSALGNWLTKFVFKIASGVKVTDTQTGLRAFRKEYLYEFTKLEGDRYEYEMKQLMYCAERKIPLSEVRIETIYENGNETSHFNPLKDSFRIYKTIYLNSTFLKCVTSSVVSFLVDFIIASILQSYVFNKSPLLENAGFFGKIITSYSASMTCAWIISSLLNFSINKTWAFHSKNHLLRSLIGFYILATPVFILKTFVFTPILEANDMSFKITYLIVNIVMYFLNYIIQKKFIFKKRDK